MKSRNLGKKSFLFKLPNSNFKPKPFIKQNKLATSKNNFNVNVLTNFKIFLKYKAKNTIQIQQKLHITA